MLIQALNWSFYDLEGGEEDTVEVSNYTERVFEDIDSKD